MCDVADCGREMKGHGLCSTHLAQKRRTGEVWPINGRPRKRQPPTCSFPGCDRASHGHGLCQSHAQQVANGWPLAEFKPRYCLPDGHFRCGACGEVKPVGDFSSPSAGRSRRHTCKSCHASKMREWNKKNPEKVRASRLKKNFGLSVATYDEMYAAQGAACAICAKHLPHHVLTGTGKRKGDTWTCVDHDHVSGAVRGLLCNTCNQALGLMRDDTGLLEAAIMYLRRNQIETA